MLAYTVGLADAGSNQAMNNQASPAFAFVREFSERLSNGTLDLPACPAVALRIQQALSNAETSAHQFAKLAMMDPVLTAKLLQLANSALLNRGTMTVTDLNDAITRIGFDMVRNLAFDVGIERTFSLKGNNSLRALHRDVRKHSHQVSILAFLLSRQFDLPVRPEEAMLAGLMHDIGKLYILTRVAAYPALFGDRENFDALLSAWHTGVGRAIVELWGFPEPIAMAVDEHEELARSASTAIDLADVVLVANLLSHRGEPRYEEKPPVEQIPAFRRLNLDTERCTRFVERTRSVVDSIIGSLAD